MSLNKLRAAACIVFGLAFLNASAADTIKIAYVGGMSGPVALQALEVLKAFQAATSLVNSRGGALGG